MTVVAAFLALALAASPSTPPRRTGLDPSSSARARAGLLPRKPARTGADVRGRRLLTIKTPAPTYLAEPAPLAEDAPREVEPLAAADAAPWHGAVAAGDGERVAVRGPVATLRLPSKDGAPPEPAEGPPAIAPPEEIGAVRVAALGVETEVTLRMRFEP